MTGSRKAAPPRTMKLAPIALTKGTENAPAVTAASPYRESHSAGRRSWAPCPAMAIVANVPSRIVGAKLSTNDWPARELRGMLTERAFAIMVARPTVKASTASPTQIGSHSDGAATVAMPAEAIAVAPIIMRPNPGTALKRTARSMTWRMNSRSSVARDSRKEVVVLNRLNLALRHAVFKCFALQSAVSVHSRSALAGPAHRFSCLSRQRSRAGAPAAPTALSPSIACHGRRQTRPRSPVPGASPPRPPW